MISALSGYSGYSSCMQNCSVSRPDPRELFEKADSDGSGGISQTELEDWVGAMPETNGIDLTDAVSTYDTDGDGELSDDELNSFMKETLPPPPGMMGMGPAKPADGLFQALDSDSSSDISESELTEWANAMSEEKGESIDASEVFSEYDTDGDDALSSDELQAFLDDTAAEPAQNTMRDAIASYSMNFDYSQALNMQDLFMNTGAVGQYTPFHYPA